MISRELFLFDLTHILESPDRKELFDDDYHPHWWKILSILRWLNWFPPCLQTIPATPPPVLVDPPKATCVRNYTDFHCGKTDPEYPIDVYPISPAAAPGEVWKRLIKSNPIDLAEDSARHTRIRLSDELFYFW